MKEEFLHFIWEHKLFTRTNLKTVDGKRSKSFRPDNRTSIRGPTFSMHGSGLEKQPGQGTSKFIKNRRIGTSTGTKPMLLTIT